MCNAFDQETIKIFSVFDVFMFIIIIIVCSDSQTLETSFK